MARPVEIFARESHKSMGMNCWQFVLICLMQSGFLTLEDLKQLYAHAASNPKNRIPDFMHGNTNHTLVDAFQAGDVLFFLKDKVIWHQAIAVSTSEYVHCLGENVARSSFQPTYDHIFKMSPPEVARAVRTLKAPRFFKAPVIICELRSLDKGGFCGSANRKWRIAFGTHICNEFPT